MTLLDVAATVFFSMVVGTSVVFSRKVAVVASVGIVLLITG